MIDSVFRQNKFSHTSSGRILCRQVWRKVWDHEDKKKRSESQARQGTAAVIWFGLCRVGSPLSAFSRSLCCSELHYFSLNFIFTGKGEHCHFLPQSYVFGTHPEVLPWPWKRDIYTGLGISQQKAGWRCLAQKEICSWGKAVVEALPIHICPQCNYHQDYIIFIWPQAFRTEILASPEIELWYLTPKSFIQELAQDQCRVGVSCN